MTVNVSSIKFGKMELLHSYQKHGVNKAKIDKSLKRVKEVLKGKQGNKIIYCQDYLVVVVNKDNTISADKSTSPITSSFTKNSIIVPCLLSSLGISISPCSQATPSINLIILPFPSIYDLTINSWDKALVILLPIPCSPEENSPFFLLF